jgi:hypothetical protein
MRAKRRVAIVGLLLGLVLSPAVSGPQGSSPSAPCPDRARRSSRMASGCSSAGRSPGPDARAELFDPRTGARQPLSATLQYARAWHTATVLADGSVLILGGIGPDGRGVPAAERLLLDVETFELAAAAPEARAHHTATLLTDGRLLVVGGVAKDGTAWAQAEVGPASGTGARPDRGCRPIGAYCGVAADRGRLDQRGVDLSGAPVATDERYDLETAFTRQCRPIPPRPSRNWPSRSWPTGRRACPSISRSRCGSRGPCAPRPSRPNRPPGGRAPEITLVVAARVGDWRSSSRPGPEAGARYTSRPRPGRPDRASLPMPRFASRLHRTRRRATAGRRFAAWRWRWRRRRAGGDTMAGGGDRSRPAGRRRGGMGQGADEAGLPLWFHRDHRARARCVRSRGERPSDGRENRVADGSDGRFLLTHLSAAAGSFSSTPAGQRSGTVTAFEIGVRPNPRHGAAHTI